MSLVKSESGVVKLLNFHHEKKGVRKPETTLSHQGNLERAEKSFPRKNYENVGTSPLLRLILRGVQGQKFWEHDSEITSDLKGLQRGPTFWSGFEALDP